MSSARSMKAAHEHLYSLPKCGAYAKSTGLPCQKPGIGAGQRCRHHGGASIGRPRITGKFCREQRLLTDWCRLVYGVVQELHPRKSNKSKWIKPKRMARRRVLELFEWRGIAPPWDL